MNDRRAEHGQQRDDVRPDAGDGDPVGRSGSHGGALRSLFVHRVFGGTARFAGYRRGRRRAAGHLHAIVAQSAEPSMRAAATWQRGWR